MLQGLPRLHPDWFTEVHFAGYEPKESKIEFRFMPSFLYSMLSAGVLSSGFWESDIGWLGGDPGILAFPVGVAVLLLFLQLPPCIFYMWIVVGSHMKEANIWL